MIDLLKILLLPLLAALGWWIKATLPRIGGLLNLGAASVVLALWLLDSLLGIFAGTAGLHRLLAHAALIAIWIAVPLALGLFLQDAVATGDSTSGMGAIVSFLALPFSLLTAATGYLGPTHAATTTHPIRFGVLHLLVGPGLSTALMIAWLLSSFRVYRQS
jgi:hypothetical protein